MKLENIGFYTLEDDRAENVSIDSDLWRCELILTDKCNFKCPYCRGIKEKFKNELSFEEAKRIVDLWADGNLKNIRFSGGEPTVWKHLNELIKYTKSTGIQRIAISTNGSADYEKYEELVESGVNDFSISLDACCSSKGDMMAGGIQGAWEKLTQNIRKLSKISYVTVGVVLTEDNMGELNEIIDFASKDLGVSDIRIISAAQYNEKFKNLSIQQEILKKHPILNYRVDNFKNGRDVRGIKSCDNSKCPLVLDDMAVNNGHHFPCIIYMRELGEPIGKMEGSIQDIRKVREDWYNNTDCSKNKICKNNCLDVCVDYNNKARKI